MKATSVLYSVSLLITIALAKEKNEPEKFHCYTCESSSTKECGDPFDETYIPRLTCAVAESIVQPTAPFFGPTPLFSAVNQNALNGTFYKKNDLKCGCYKIVVNNKFGDKILVSRGSAMGSAVNDSKVCKMFDDQVKSMSKGSLHVGFCQGCDNELCNSAGSVSLSMMTIFSLIISYVLII